MSVFGTDAPMLVAVYRCCFDLMRSGVFTNTAMHAYLPYGGYRLDEVDAALSLLVDSGDLAIVSDDHRGVIYTAGPKFPGIPTLARDA